MTTDTPRTDAAIELYGDRPFMVSAVPVEFAEGLERELKASQAEVERLREQLIRAVEIAEEALKGACGEWGCIGKSDEEDKLLAELDQLKATLNPNKK